MDGINQGKSGGGVAVDDTASSSTKVASETSKIEGDQKNPLRSKSTMAPPAAAVAASSANSEIAQMIRKRSLSSTTSHAVASPDKKKAAVDNNDTAKPINQHYRPHPDGIEGCMLQPTNPIKIFATDEDVRLRDIGLTKRELFEPCWTMREMMGLDRFSGICREGLSMEQLTKHYTTIGIDFVFIATYILNVDCLYNELPELANIPTVVVVYEYKDPNCPGESIWRDQAWKLGHTLHFIQRTPKAQPRTKFNKDNHQSPNPLSCLMEYGCHHTKMFLVKYASGRLRVNIHTSNLRHEDIHLKCQGGFIQDFLPKTQDQLDMFESSEFEETLLTYMESYHILNPISWTHPTSTTPTPNCLRPETLVQHLQGYDFSTAVGILVPSIPGYHPLNRAEKLGYLKVEECIQKHCSQKEKKCSGYDQSTAGPIVSQCSSIGSLSAPYLAKLLVAWNVTTAGTNGKPPKEIPSNAFKIVWPTLQEIASSVEGVRGGGTVPGRTRNLVKPCIRMLLHKWDGDMYAAGSSGGGSPSCRNETMGKGNNVPHIKTYYQMSSASPQRQEEMEWFVLSSHNLSKAAWGEVQNRQVEGQVLMVQHWELGVFVSPQTLGVDSMGPLPVEGSAVENETKSRSTIPLPYKFRPDPYREEDQFWAVDLFEG